MPEMQVTSLRHEDGAQAHLVIAVPVGNGDLDVRVMHSIMTAAWRVYSKKINVDIITLANNCHVDDARNDLVAAFMSTHGATHLHFWDADVTASPDSLLRLMLANKHIIGGVYPFRDDRDDMPYRGKLDVQPNGLSQIEGLPGGFMMIQAGVVTQMWLAAAKEKGAWKSPGKNTYVTQPTAEVFHRALTPIAQGSVEGGVFRAARESGDYHFCTKARAAGYEVWVDTQLNFGHIGTKLWRGSLIKRHLTATGGWTPLITKALDAIKWENEDVRNPACLHAATIMADAYDNKPWACGPVQTALLMALVAQDDVKTILETGSGLTTAAMQAVIQRLGGGKRLMSLESDIFYEAKTRQFLRDCAIEVNPIHYAPLVEGDTGLWYDVSIGFVPDVLFIDGPKREKPGMRARVLDRLPKGKKLPKYIMVDDVDDQDGLMLLQRIGKMGYGADTMVEPGRRKFAVCTLGLVGDMPVIEPPNAA